MSFVHGTLHVHGNENVAVGKKTEHAHFRGHLVTHFLVTLTPLPARYYVVPHMCSQILTTSQRLRVKFPLICTPVTQFSIEGDAGCACRDPPSGTRCPYFVAVRLYQFPWGPRFSPTLDGRPGEQAPPSDR